MAPRNRHAANGGPSTSSGSSAKQENSATESSSDSLLASALAPLSEEREEVKVNNASVTEMKHACDDALKRVSVLLAPVGVVRIVVGRALGRVRCASGDSYALPPYGCYPALARSRQDCVRMG